MKISINLKKDINENIQNYYDKSKKAKKKLEGLDEAIANSQKVIEQIEKENIEIAEEKETIKQVRKRAWYEKFHWLFTSSGKLVIGGRDAKSNEIIVKKHMDKDDIYLHTTIAGSPSTVIKTEGKKIEDKDIEEAAVITAAYSSAWKGKIYTVDVYWVNPDQVSQTAQSGEYLQTGSFMIRGKRNFIHNVKIEISVGVCKDNEGNYFAISGNEENVKNRALDYYNIIIGNNSKSDVAKELRKRFAEKLGAAPELDELIAILPNGFMKIKK